MMPLGALNTALTFAAIIMKLHMEWDTLSKELGLKNVASKIIADDVSLYGRTAEQLLHYFRTFMDALKHHRATLKLKNANGFRTGAIF